MKLQIKDRQAKNKSWLFIVGGIFVVAALGLSGFWFFNRNQNSNSIAPSVAPVEKQTQIKRLTSKGMVDYGGLSPDGKFFAYILREQDSYRKSLWLGQTNGNSDMQLLPADDLIYFPRSFSSDGNWLYYTVSESRQSVGTLYKIPVLGGIPQKLVHDISVSVVLYPSRNGLRKIDHAEITSQKAF